MKNRAQAAMETVQILLTVHLAEVVEQLRSYVPNVVAHQMRSEELAAQHAAEMDGMKRIAPIVAGKVKFGRIVMNVAAPGILMNK